MAIAIATMLALGLGVWFGQRLMLARLRWDSMRWLKLVTKNKEVLEAALLGSIQQRSAFEARGDHHLVCIQNSLQFVLIWNWDLTTILNGLRKDTQDWSLQGGYRRKLFARLLALTIYETLDKLKLLLDPEGRRKWSIAKSLLACAATPKVLDDVGRVHRAVLGALEAHSELLIGIRKNVIGHRDQDATKQLEWMKRANSDELEKLGWELLALTNNLVEVFNQFFRDQHEKYQRRVA